MELSRRHLAWSDNGTANYRAFLLPLVALGAVLLFLAAPWPLAHKAHAALHGLCAQRPSHSFRLGAEALPFDARMTGIYGGFLATSLVLLARDRYRAAALPSFQATVLLALFVGSMAIDGTNSLLLDLQLWHPYEPDNRYRLATGMLTGIALAVAVAFLLATTLWQRPRMEHSAVNGIRELLLIVLVQLPFAAIVLSEANLLYAPTTLLLLLSATAVLSSLMLVVVILLRRVENGFTSVQQLQGYATVALVLGVLTMAALAGGRFALEYFTGPPPLT